MQARCLAVGQKTKIHYAGPCKIQNFKRSLESLVNDNHVGLPTPALDNQCVEGQNSLCMKSGNCSGTIFMFHRASGVGQNLCILGVSL
jgi:hypothetical protein